MILFPLKLNIRSSVWLTCIFWNTYQLILVKIMFDFIIHFENMHEVRNLKVLRMLYRSSKYIYCYWTNILFWSYAILQCAQIYPRNTYFSIFLQQLGSGPPGPPCSEVHQKLFFLCYSVPNFSHETLIFQIFFKQLGGRPPRPHLQ